MCGLFVCARGAQVWLLSVRCCVGAPPTDACRCLVQQAQLNTGGVAPPPSCPELDCVVLPCLAEWLGGDHDEQRRPHAAPQGGFDNLHACLG